MGLDEQPEQREADHVDQEKASEGGFRKQAVKVHASCSTSTESMYPPPRTVLMILDVPVSLSTPRSRLTCMVDAAIEYVGVAPLRLPQQILAAQYGERLVKEHEQQPVHRVAEGQSARHPAKARGSGR